MDVFYDQEAYCQMMELSYFRFMESTTDATNTLAQQLMLVAESGRADAYYRLARMVARVLVSTHLRRREKWCSLAKQLSSDPIVEERLILQAMRWLNNAPKKATV